MSFEEVLENLTNGQEEVKEAIQKIETRLTHLEGFLAGTQGYTPPAYGKPMTKAECEKLGGTWDEDTEKCTLTESVVVAAELPKTKEACEEAGGTWDEEKKVCKLSKEALESFRGILPSAQGVLPTRTPTISPEEARANALIKKITGE